MTLLNPWFWAFALTSAFLVPLRLGVPRSTGFGVLNLLALYALLGWTAPAFVLTLAFLLWWGVRSGGAWPLLVFALLFLLYKLTMEGSAVSGLLHVSREGTAFSLMAGIGFSYVFLRAWDLLSTVRHGRVALLDPLSVAGYLAPFHMLPAGPVNLYEEHATMNDRPGPASDFDSVLAGIDDVATGLFYKFVLAEAVRIFAFGVSGPLLSRSWLDTALLVVYLFFDFGGYSRVARAIGTMSGVPTPINFSAPFAAATVTEFWTRWHMSLGAFVRRNVYLPLQVRLVRAYGLRRAHFLTMLTLTVSFGFVGLWHRFTARFLLWGAAMGLIMALEKLLRDYGLARYPWLRTPTAAALLRVAGPVYVFLIFTTSIHLVIAELLRP